MYSKNRDMKCFFIIYILSFIIIFKHLKFDLIIKFFKILHLKIIFINLILETIFIYKGK